jgi:hypothetical protein
MKEQEFYNLNGDLAPYLEHLDYNVDQASKLLGLLFYLHNHIDDEGNITSLPDFNKDALDQLIATAKRLSSYADKFQSKVSEVSKKLADEFK